MTLGMNCSFRWNFIQVHNALTMIFDLSFFKMSVEVRCWVSCMESENCRQFDKMFFSLFLLAGN